MNSEGLQRTPAFEGFEDSEGAEGAKPGGPEVVVSPDEQGNTADQRQESEASPQDSSAFADVAGPGFHARLESRKGRLPASALGFRLDPTEIHVCS